MRSLNFKTRLWVGHVVVLAVMLTLAALGADRAVRRMVIHRLIDDQIFSLASALAPEAIDLAEEAALRADPRQSIRIDEVAPSGSPPSFARLDKFIQIIDLDGGVVARSATLGTARLPALPGLLARLRDGETVFRTVKDFGEERVRMVSLPIGDGPPRYAIQVAMSLGDAYAVVRVGRWLFLGMSAVMLTGIGLTGAQIARRALQPIDEVVAKARRIGETNLAERLPHPGRLDEIGRLVETLNGMLDRLERSFEVQRRFTADASHELRSPLSRLRTELEVSLRRPRAAAEYEETHRSCLDEVEQIQRLIDELLQLARIDARQEPEQANPIPVSEIVEAAVTAVRWQVEQRGVTVAVERPSELLVNAAPGAAKVALANVLDNAVKFSPTGGQVRIVVTAGRGEAVIAVSDDGPGVSSEDVMRLFDRFYRGQASRLTGAAGVGLGLAISRALLERLGGRISVGGPTEKGATFSVHLPCA